MATNGLLNDYRFFINGNTISILQRRVDETYRLYKFDIDALYVTPTVNDTDAIYVRYTKENDIPNSETDDLGISHNLSLAVVHYIKYRLLEDRDPRLSSYNYRMFLKLLQRERNNRTSKPHASTSHYVGAVK